MFTLQESATHKLTLEKTAGQWWLEVIDRASGITSILYFNRKDKAQAFFKGMTLPEIVAMLPKLRPEVCKMYKEGV